MEPEKIKPESTFVGHTLDFTSIAVKALKKLIILTEDFMNFIMSKVLNQDVMEKEENPEEKLIKEVNTARIEWLAAKSSFVYISDDDLIDQAIYAISAAEKKYLYLLKIAKKQNLTINYSNVDYNRHLYKGKEFNI